tara:strand:- start:201 stop:395 length:195 start_codon:yes stop_codon:yes gene_type:complete
MTQESGTKECHIFIESKNEIEKILYRLSSVDNTYHICELLKSSYKLIDGMHELKISKSKNSNEA